MEFDYEAAVEFYSNMNDIYEYWNQPKPQQVYQKPFVPSPTYKTPIVVQQPVVVNHARGLSAPTYATPVIPEQTHQRAITVQPIQPRPKTPPYIF